MRGNIIKSSQSVAGGVGSPGLVSRIKNVSAQVTAWWRILAVLTIHSQHLPAD